MLALLLYFSLHATATEKVCGLYQNEDFGDRVIHMITSFDGKFAVTYAIQNPASKPAASLLRGFCYCVAGDVRLDPEYPGDEAYRILNVRRIEGEPFIGCIPGR